ncbi:hypothetical protein [Cronobacter sakazakii]|uniref:hypothetical protein n=1 Tax=Cronobacter sakazakii TaxID=28141 RepID=UPI002895B248|nr:hypothetical protein [Cronobacter sakazakii]MDT3544883.1 hypothetical protein [Cronobacter sakazakii]
MANNEIKPFATGANANVTPQGEWENLPALLTGFSSGKASSAQVNKAIRQASFVAATLAQFIADQSGEDVRDDGDQAGLIAKLFSAINKTSQPLDETLVALAALATGANKLPYFTGNDTAAVTDLTAIGRNIIGKGSIADVLSYLGLGDLPDSFGTAAGKNVGTGADDLPTTSQADDRYRLKHWSNSPGVVVATNTPIKINHGLTIDPDLCVLNIKYRCLADNNGYKVGDYCIGFGPRVTGGETQAVAGSLGALITDEYCQFNVGNAGMYIMQKNSGVTVALNSPSSLSQWALEFHILYQ